MAQKMTDFRLHQFIRVLLEDSSKTVLMACLTSCFKVFPARTAFVRRVLLHLLPSGIKRIRHHGAGGQDGCGLVPVLQGGQVVHHRRARIDSRAGRGLACSIDPLRGLARSIDATNKSAHNLLWHTGREACKPLCRTRPPFAVAVQSNKVYLPQEVLLVSKDLASRQISAIRSFFVLALTTLQNIGTATYAQGTSLPAPTNAFSGTCAAFNQKVRELGVGIRTLVLDGGPSFQQYPGWGGATNWKVKYESPPLVKRREGESLCWVIDFQSYPFSMESQVTTFSWVEGPSSCAGPYSRYFEAVNSHEIRHVGDLQTAIERERRAWRPTTFKLCGDPKDDARGARETVRRNVQLYLTEGAAYLQGILEFEGRSFHTTGTGGPLQAVDCSKCK